MFRFSNTANTPLLRVLAATAIAGFITCASAGDKGKTLTEKLEKYKYQQGAPVESINDYELDGWNYIDSTHIVIHTGPSRHYLISLMSSCHDLSTAENIAFTTTTNELTKFDKLMVRGAGDIVQHCPITQINALTKKKAAD
jgi:hypothetical protein